MASQQARELAGAIEAVNLELIQLVRGCSEEQWRTECNDEGDNRTVAVIAHHVGHGHVNTEAWLQNALTGDEVTITLDEINAENAEHAATYHDVARKETIQLLIENGDRLCSRIAELSDEELARKAFHRGAGRDMTVAAFALLGQRHVSGHLATIRQALDLPVWGAV
ncbi:MAG: DinB family protein [Candidatus Dormibacteraeota bacterium]|nr:DinB family protein [Candidatus Dormibacteraeota bacterium]